MRRRLCPAEKCYFHIEAVPLVRPLAQTVRAEPERRAKPIAKVDANGGAKPRRTSGGVAAAVKLLVWKSSQAALCKSSAAAVKLLLCKSNQATLCKVVGRMRNEIEGELLQSTSFTAR